MATIHQLKTPPRRRATASEYIDPAKLHERLEPTTLLIMTFRTEKEMERYRRLIYSINRQGDYRFRTMRDEYSMFGIAIWRMK